ncbi:pseudouridine synthase [Petrocella sp. FN5]|uniref:pseudouridine synthase n=1 Tax=Petrocella sp. FN5 TaxID=3032002 RepID=UPI0023DB3224|nr:pseudouridine synthase [Petrocella sp. FN5]MDF1617000.1 pseudouridine synthase [Petrocella sp. FN5]
MSMRLDKYLSNMGVGTRREVKKLIQYGKVMVNKEVVKTIDYKVAEDKDHVMVYGKTIGYAVNVYMMLNKPAGCITATQDTKDKTVLDLVNHKRKKDLFPIGRLDKDTEGLLILTNDGQLAHRLLSPKKHVPKVYYARIKGCVTLADCKLFLVGVTLDDGYKTMPAKLEILSAGEASEVYITIHEGKFHQVKRMFEAVDKEVVYLKRIQMGGLSLDSNLKLGGYRELREDEVQALETF